jgi:benzylsuccinate CoA-transferase BbsF subunit
VAGFHYINGWPDRPPHQFGIYTDWIAPHFCLLAIMAALDYRRRTGKGQYIDLSQFETGVHFEAPLVLDYVVNGRVAKRMGNRLDHAAPHGAFRCRGEDRWCVMAVFTDEEWYSFCKVIGNPSWTEDPRFVTLHARKQNEDELEKLVESWTINYLAEEVVIMMQSAGVPAGVVENSRDRLDYDPQLRHVSHFVTLDHPEVGKYRVAHPPYQLSRCEPRVYRTPLLGEHNEYVCKQILGMTDDELADMLAEGVVE